MAVVLAVGYGLVINIEVQIPMISTAIALLSLLVVPPHKEVEETVRKLRIERWQALFQPLVIDTKLELYFSCVDPRASAEFTKFTGEYLDPGIIEYSKLRFGDYFQKEANPFASGMEGPSGYRLASRPGFRSLLLYEWKSFRYSFQLLENSYGVLLRIRPHTTPLMTKEGVPADRVAAILDEVLGQRVFEKQKAAECFSLSGTLKPGHVFTNAKYYGMALLDDWHENIVGFLTDQEVCLFVFKLSVCQSGLVGFPEEEWIPLYLREKEGGPLVIERLWGKPYPRPKVQPGSKDGSHATAGETGLSQPLPALPAATPVPVPVPSPPGSK